MTIAAEAAELEDGGDADPDDDDEEDGPPVLVEVARPKVIRRSGSLAQTFGPVD